MKGFDDYLDNYGDPDPSGEETVNSYRMNPAEDTILFGDELEEGMWVLPEEPILRAGDGDLRGELFRRVTRVRLTPAYGASPVQVAFVGEWIDGYKKMHSASGTTAWIVKKGDYSAESETADILADRDTLAAIREGEAFELLAYPLDNDPDDGITTDDFDNWPTEREFPS